MGFRILFEGRRFFFLKKREGEGGGHADVAVSVLFFLFLFPFLWILCMSKKQTYWAGHDV